MDKNQQKAYDELKALGCPVFERADHPKGFFISAEHEESWKWADYYNYDNPPELRLWNGETTNPKIGEVLKPLGLFAEWENPGCLGVYEI